MVTSIANYRENPDRRLPMELSLRSSHLNRLTSRHSTPLQWDLGMVVAKPLLDRVELGLSGDLNTADESMSDLFAGLHAIKTEAAPEVWNDVVKQCINHRVIELIHQDPFTARSFNKPRGYAGDAVLIDYIYDRSHYSSKEQPVSELGDLVFNFTTSAPASAGVRTRRDLMASIIDETCTMIEGPQILSVACGHLREATLSRSIASHDAGRFVALDQDELSLAVVTESMPDQGIFPICSSIKALFRGELAGERFDLIYSTGLYDYLEDRIAVKLTTRLFDMLNPGGRLVLANFLPDIWCAGYMETFMGWRLIYRSPEQMADLTDAIPADSIAAKRVYSEKNLNIVFLDVWRRE